MFTVSATDNSWFHFLKNSGLNSYVNFWTPTPWNIKKLKDGDRWYFLLKSPIRKLGGFGEFYEYKNLTAENAWNEFGYRNGCTDKAEFIKRIQLYIDKNSKEFGGKTINIFNYEIGCVVLKNCQFWDDDKFIKTMDYQIDFPTQVVKYKYYNQTDPFLDSQTKNEDITFNLVSEPREIYKKEINQRKGQSEFKGKILKAYNNKCCISSEICPELLEAAHIQPYLTVDSNHVQNGLLLRVDLHRLYDNGLLYIDNEYIVHISSLIKSTTYQKFNGIKISLPNNQNEFPSKYSLGLKKDGFRN